MAYTYALMQEDETPEVSALMTASFPKSYRRIFFIKPEHTVVAREGNQVVGGMNMDVFSLPNKRKVGYLGWLYVEKDHQGQGIGNALTEQAIAHLKDVGCTDIIACVEGDNSSSLKQFANHGFTIMSIREQVSRFGIGLLKVNKRAARFFDMGYFLWHLSIPEEMVEEPRDQRPFAFTVLCNILLWYPCLKGWNLLNMLFPGTMADWTQDPFYQRSPLFLLLVPVFALTVRTLSMEISARIQQTEVTFLSWDTAWLLGVLLPLLVGIPFPVPGNVYIAGTRWRNSDMDSVLCRIARTGQLALAFLCLPLKGSIALRYCYTLMFLDSLFFFYPFTGFNSSRVKKRGADSFIIPSVSVLMVTVMLW